MEERPHWMIDHEMEDRRHFAEIKQDVMEIKTMLMPIADTYKTVATLGKWGKLLLGFVLLVLSVGVAARSLFKL